MRNRRIVEALAANTQQRMNRVRFAGLEALKEAGQRPLSAERGNPVQKSESLREYYGRAANDNTKGMEKEQEPQKAEKAQKKQEKKQEREQEKAIEQGGRER